ncbi:MAG: hypothetical protein C5B52_03035 [Bacteroidetes bacterium]|nr:MAG: hypothetical protein C5B52_03035 [Bacteroidota bacterium]
MKKLIILLALVIPATMLRAQDDKGRTPFLTKNLSKENIKNVDVQTSGGSINVSGGTAAESRIEVYVWPNNDGKAMPSKEEIQKRINEDYDLNISVDGGKLTAYAKPKDRNMNWKKSLSISFKIYVTENASTHLRTSGGSIGIKNLAGTQDFATSGGSLDIQKVSGQINGRTSGGSITVSDSKDNIDIETSGGSIHAENCTGTITMNTSGGSLTLKQLQGNIKATTSGGSINGGEIRGDLEAHTSGGNVDLNALYCGLETSTSGGNIDVEIKELGKQVKITNSGGNIDLSMPKNKGVNLRLRGDKIKVESLENFSGRKDDDEIDGTLNGGGIPVTVKAGSGRIRLDMK